MNVASLLQPSDSPPHESRQSSAPTPQPTIGQSFSQHDRPNYQLPSLPTHRPPLQFRPLSPSYRDREREQPQSPYGPPPPFSQDLDRRSSGGGAYAFNSPGVGGYGQSFPPYSRQSQPPPGQLALQPPPPPHTPVPPPSNTGSQGGGSGGLYAPGSSLGFLPPSGLYASPSSQQQQQQREREREREREQREPPPPLTYSDIPPSGSSASYRARSLAEHIRSTVNQSQQQQQQIPPPTLKPRRNGNGTPGSSRIPLPSIGGMESGQRPMGLPSNTARPPRDRKDRDREGDRDRERDRDRDHDRERDRDRDRDRERDRARDRAIRERERERGERIERERERDRQTDKDREKELQLQRHLSLARSSHSNSRLASPFPPPPSLAPIAPQIQALTPPPPRPTPSTSLGTYTFPTLPFPLPPQTPASNLTLYIPSSHLYLPSPEDGAALFGFGEYTDDSDVRLAMIHNYTLDVDEFLAKREGWDLKVGLICWGSVASGAGGGGGVWRGTEGGGGLRSFGWGGGHDGGGFEVRSYEWVPKGTATGKGRARALRKRRMREDVEARRVLGLLPSPTLSPSSLSISDLDFGGRISGFERTLEGGVEEFENGEDVDDFVMLYGDASPDGAGRFAYTETNLRNALFPPRSYYRSTVAERRKVELFDGPTTFGEVIDGRTIVLENEDERFYLSRAPSATCRAYQLAFASKTFPHLSQEDFQFVADGIYIWLDGEGRAKGKWKSRIRDRERKGWWIKVKRWWIETCDFNLDGLVDPLHDP